MWGYVQHRMPPKKQTNAAGTKAKAGGVTRGYTPTSREDKDGRKVYTKAGKDYVKRKKKDGTFGMRQVVHKEAKGGGAGYSVKERTELVSPFVSPFRKAEIRASKMDIREIKQKYYELLENEKLGQDFRDQIQENLEEIRDLRVDFIKSLFNIIVQAENSLTFRKVPYEDTLPKQTQLDRVLAWSDVADQTNTAVFPRGDRS